MGTPAFDLRLKQRRKALGLTQDTLARRVGCATITIQKLEAGTLRPSPQMAERLANQLDMDPKERLVFLAAARSTPVPPPILASGNAALPIPPTPLIGRGPFVAAVCATIQRADVQLLTLVGPPGVGKTRVALQVAHTLQPSFRDGTVFVALAPIGDPELILSSIAQALNLPEATNQPLLVELKAALQSGERLLVLDNFEQVVAAASLINELLEVAPALKVLVTSRAALLISGEHQLPVPPLALPDLHDLPSADALAHVPAVALFVQRARAVAPQFVLTETNAADVAAICHRLDGLPLALELAAVRSKLFPPHALLARLERPLAVLTVGARNLPIRQQTLRSTIAWSYDLLPPREQALFARLGVFVGGFTSDAVADICTEAGDLPVGVLDGLALLLDHSLVQHALNATGEARFSLLETVREYALEQLRERNEADILGERHARYYVHFAEQADAQLHGPRQVIWLDWLDQEYQNIRAALRWAVQHGAAQLGLRLAGALTWFWGIYGLVREGYQLVRALLPLVDTVSIAVQAKVLLGAAALACAHGKLDQSSALLPRSVDLSRSVGNWRDTAFAWALLGVLAAYSGEIEQAAQWHRQSIALMRETSDTWGLAVALGSQGVSAFNLQRLDQAETCFSEAITLFRYLGDAWGVMYSGTFLGLTLLHKGEYQRAEQILLEGMRAVQVLGARVSNPESLEGLAATAVARGQIERAVRLSGAAEALREAIGSFMSPAVQSMRESYLALARAQLDEATFEEAWEAGRAMSLKQAIMYALETA
jgi:predicted ATPase/transcriptional regulator with XRE-family HTH domain